MAVLAPGRVSVFEQGVLLGQAPFTPMLPDDDQLIPYGLDTSVSVTHTRPAALQKDFVASVTVEQDGARIRRRRVRATRYAFKNNASKQVPTFYLDHQAAMHDGG